MVSRRALLSSNAGPEPQWCGPSWRTGGSRTPANGQNHHQRVPGAFCQPASRIVAKLGQDTAVSATLPARHRLATVLAEPLYDEEAVPPARGQGVVIDRVVEAGRGPALKLRSLLEPLPISIPATALSTLSQAVAVSGGVEVERLVEGGVQVEVLAGACPATACAG
jgi:hypothetical protein